MTSVFEQMQRIRILPILTRLAPDDAPALGDALVAGGLGCAEVTLRTPEASRSLALLAGRGDLVVGAGTITNVDLAKRAVDAGARFLVSPAVSPAVLSWAAAHDVPMVPGVATPADIERAMDAGAGVLKFFPCEIMGGIAAMREYTTIYPAARFVATGGITLEKLPQYLAIDRVAAVGGTWMLGGADLIDAKRFDQITETVRTAVALALSTRGVTII